MKNLKTYEGFFDFFKSRPSEDDKIALEYINRLKKVKGISPYEITFDEVQRENNNFEVDKWTVDFEDTPIKLWSFISLISNGFDEQYQELLSKKLAKYSKKEFYGMKIMCDGKPENCKPNPKILKELVELVKSVYENDKEARRIEKINLNINPMADKIGETNESIGFENFSDVVDEIETILLGLKDRRFGVILEKEENEEEDTLYVEIKNSGKGYLSPFDSLDIIEELERVERFCHHSELDLEIKTHTKHHSQRTREIFIKSEDLVDREGSPLDYNMFWVMLTIKKIKIEN